MHEMRDGWIILEDGTVAVGYTVKGFEDETLSEEACKNLTQGLAKAWRHFPKGTIVQKLDIYYPKAPKSLAHKSLLYLAYTPNKAPYEPHNTFFALGHAGLQAPFKDLKNSLKTLATLKASLEASLPAEWQARQMTDQENLTALYAYFNLTFENTPRHFERTLWSHKRRLQIGEYHLGAVTMQRQGETPQYASKNDRGVRAPFSHPLFEALRVPHITLQAFAWQDTEALLARHREALEWEEGAARKYRHQEHAHERIEKVAALEKAIRENAETLVATNIIVIAFEKSEAALASALEKTRKAFYRIGAIPLIETYDVANLFFAAMPAGAVQLYRGLNMALETALVYLNPTTNRKGAPAGIQLCDRNRQPLCYDPFNLALDNQHAFVFGPSGAGKSFLNGKMIKERYEQGHMVIVLDSGKTYERLFKALNGKYIAYAPEKPLGLNPFLVRPTNGRYIPSERKLLFLLELIAKMWKGDLDAYPLQEVEKTLLITWISSYYQSLEKEAVPMLKGFYQWLQESAHKGAIKTSLFPLEAFFIVLEPFATGRYTQHFNAEQTTMLSDHRLICFELEALKARPRLYPLVV